MPEPEQIPPKSDKMEELVPEEQVTSAGSTSHLSSADCGKTTESISDQSSATCGEPAESISNFSNAQSKIENKQSGLSTSGAQPRIFVTVGTDLPFDRMVRTIDNWAGKTEYHNIFAQIGETDWKPKCLCFSKYLPPAEFNKHFAEADIIISHAGMGTILSALKKEKKLLIMPRIAAKGEQRNEHQLATVGQLARLGKVNVVSNESELASALLRLDEIASRGIIGTHANPVLTDKIRKLIFS